MFIWWGSKTKVKKAGTGRFDCPSCKSEQPCDLFFLGTYFSVYSIALTETERLDEFVVCGRCNRNCSPASYRPISGGIPAPPVTWDCPQCRAVNPNHSYSCLKCKLSLV